MLPPPGLSLPRWVNVRLTAANCSKTLTGNIEQVRVHLNGLRQMVNLRGDLSKLPLTVVSQISTLVILIPSLLWTFLPAYDKEI